MDRLELQRLQTLYHEMDDQGLASALYYGPESYVAPEVWAIIVSEASRRGIAVPNKEEREAHWEEVRAEEAALQPPKLPWGWRLYFWLACFVLFGLVQLSCEEIVRVLYAPADADGWQLEDLKLEIELLAWVFVVLLVLGVQYAHVRARLSAKADQETLSRS